MASEKQMKKILSMRSRVNEYLDYRRSLGYKLAVTGRRLLKFADYADKKKFRGPITEELIIELPASQK